MKQNMSNTEKYLNFVMSRLLLLLLLNSEEVVHCGTAENGKSEIVKYVDKVGLTSNSAILH
jgi:hypothetical protein